MRDTEIRSTLAAVQIREAGGGRRLGGYALKFDRLSQNLGGFVERVAPGALTKTLRDGGDVLCRYQHADEYLLGRTASGTLRLTVDDEGLDYEVDLPDTTVGRDVGVLAGRGDVQHSSFAFRTLRDDWSYTEQGFPLRTLLEIQLVDVAPVVQPAYLDTTSGLRQLAEARHLDLDAVRAAAASGQLADLLRAGPTDEPPSDPHGPSIALLRRRHPRPGGPHLTHTTDPKGRTS